MDIVDALTAVVLIQLALMVVMYAAMSYLRNELVFVKNSEHAACMAGVMAFVGNEWAAQVLEVAATDYASVEAQQDKDRIGRLVWQSGGEPVPSLWLRERADQLRGETEEDETKEEGLFA